MQEEYGYARERAERFLRGTSKWNDKPSDVAIKSGIIEFRKKEARQLYNLRKRAQKLNKRAARKGLSVRLKKLGGGIAEMASPEWHPPKRKH